jgi:arginase
MTHTAKRLVHLRGLPTDSHSSYLRGAAAGPGFIRKALASDHGNLASERGLEIGREIDLVDCGDVPLNEDDQDAAGIIRAIAESLDVGAMPLSLGGDHSVTFPIVEAIANRLGPVQILHFDAHPDLYDDFDGDPRSHASPFARIMERGLATKLVQVGIRTMNAHQRAQVARFGVESVEMRTVESWRMPQFDGPLYVSIDLDAFDPAFAPGVSHHEPGGLSPRQVINWVLALNAPLIGADVVELNPSRDQDGVTAILAAKLVKELAAASFTVVGA